MNDFTAMNEVRDLQQKMQISSMIQQNIMQHLSELKDIVLQYQTKHLQVLHPNPLNRFGKKCFSQTDEDGITLEILRRLDIKDGTYAEFGVGNGLENNTLILAALGWRGFWVGGEELAFDWVGAENFNYIKSWITLENIVGSGLLGKKNIGIGELDVISLDLDGNDIYFVEELIKNGFAPKLFIVEYNAKFPPPIKFKISYNPQHQWGHDDYYGASLSAYNDLFVSYGYKLVCCNSHSGANAFFVKKDFENLFADVPKNIEDIYVPPRFHVYSNYGHKMSARVVKQFIK